MIHAVTPRQALALALAFVLPFLLTGPDVLAAVAGGVASIEGRVVLADGKTPWEGVVLRITPVGSKTTYESASTDAQGRFSLSDLPAGDYTLAVRDGTQLHRMGPGVRLAPGKHDEVLVGIAPARTDDDEEEDDDDEAAAVIDTETTLLDNPLTITLLALSGLTLILWGADELDDDDNPVDVFASPSAP